MLLGINESASRCQECQTILIDNYSVEKKLCIEDDHERLAKLLLSVNQTKNSLRPLTPLEVAKEIKVWMEEKSLNKIEGVHGFKIDFPIDNNPIFCGVNPSTSFIGNMLETVANSSN